MLVAGHGVRVSDEVYRPCKGVGVPASEVFSVAIGCTLFVRVLNRCTLTVWRCFVGHWRRG